MHIKSIAAVSALAFAASTAAAAEAAVERPRIYYPRQVKREFFNTTATTTDAVSTSDKATTTTSGKSTSRRGAIGGLISDLLGPNSDGPSPTQEGTTVVVISNTVIVTPTPETHGTGGAPDVTVQPTTKTRPTSKPESVTDKRKSSTDSSSESGILIAPTGIVSSSKGQPTSASDKDAAPTSLANSTSTDAQQPLTSTTSTGGLLDPIGSLLSTLLGDPTSTNSSSLPTETSFELPTIAFPTAGSTSTSAGSSNFPSSDPTQTSTDGPKLSTTTSASSASGVITPPASVTTDPPFITSSSDVPVVNSTSSGSIPPATSSGTSIETLTSHSSTVPTDVPVTNATSSAPVTTVSLPITSTAADNSTVALPTASHSTVVPTTTASPSSTEATSIQPVTSIRPTATLTNTENWLPTTIVIEPTSMSFSVPTQSPTGTSSKTLPTGLPKLILPDDPNKPVPEGTVPIQIGFLYPLNYAFVAGNTVAASQIFKFLPQALADDGGFTSDIVQVSKLVPDDTRDKWGYVTTIARLNYPQNLVDKLQMDLWSPNSGIYNNADPLVRNLTSLINPKIDIHGNINDGGVGPSSGGAVPTSGPGPNNDPFNNNQQGDQSSKQKATTAGIAMGAVGISVMYGAAMFIVARRYKRKRQTHRRSSSVANSQGSSEMRYNGTGSPALMGGALLSHDFSNYGGAGAGGRDSHNSGRSGAGNSGRTANISAPVAAENSLGWN